jgi:zinc/manganese transport system substrate-binding protein
MPRLRAFAAILLATATTAALAGCAPEIGDPADDGVVSVVASTNVYGDIAAQVGGDLVEVTSIIDDPERDPHEYEADARNQLALARADVVIENGGGYDDFVDTMLAASGNASAAVLTAVDLSGRDPEPGDGAFNEHVWYDYSAMGALASALADALARVDPSHASAYRANAAELTRELDDLTATAADLEGRYAGEGVAITEPVPLYVLDAIGLVNRTPAAFSEAIEADTDVPPGVLEETLDLFSAHQVVLLAYNAQTTGPQTERVLAAAEEAGVAVVPVTETLPSGVDYLTWQRDFLAQLDAALAR